MAVAQLGFLSKKDGRYVLAPKVNWKELAWMVPILPKTPPESSRGEYKVMARTLRLYAEVPQMWRRRRRQHSMRRVDDYRDLALG